MRTNINFNINVVIAGDFSPIGRTVQICEEKNYKELYNDVLPFLIEKDLSIADLECPLTNEISPISKTGPNLIAPERCIDAIRYACFDVVSLANNHILDQGEAALLRTLELCNENDIKTVGAGKNLKDAQKPLYINIKGKTIGIISICENEFSIARNDRAGANPLDIISNFHAIQNAKKECDYLLLIVHGGIEHYSYPTIETVKRYRFFIEVGADAVVSHHTHIASGYEIYKGKPIFYGIGNFVFDRFSDFSTWYEGYLVNLRISIKDYSTDFEIIPFEQFKEKPGLSLMKGIKKEKFINKINKISNIINDEKKLKNCLLQYIEDKHINQIATFLPFIPFKQKIIKSKKYPATVRNILLSRYNTLRCESLREIALESFKLLFEK